MTHCHHIHNVFNNNIAHPQNIPPHAWILITAVSMGQDDDTGRRFHHMHEPPFREHDCADAVRTGQQNS